MTKEDILKKTPTRQLMTWRDKTYRNGGVYDPDGNGALSVEEILAELNTREHVPNKTEAKAIRQARAKQGI